MILSHLKNNWRKWDYVVDFGNGSLALWLVCPVEFEGFSLFQSVTHNSEIFQ